MLSLCQIEKHAPADADYATDQCAILERYERELHD